MDDDYVAYCLNQAVAYLGNYVDGEMDKASKRAKNEKQAESLRKAALQRILAPRKQSNSGFADPALLLK